MILHKGDIDAAAFAAATGWEIKPEGACKADMCVPIDSPGAFDVVATAGRLGMAIVRDSDSDLWALGPESFSGQALATAVAPALTLSDLDGNEFRLASLRGQKVAVVAWAPY